MKITIKLIFDKNLKLENYILRPLFDLPSLTALIASAQNSFTFIEKKRSKMTTWKFSCRFGILEHF